MPAIGAAIVAVAGAVGTAVAAIGATTVGSFLLRLGATLALTAVARALAPKPRDSGLTTRTTLTGGTNPMTFVLGRSATAGVLAAPPLTHGGNHAYLTYVVALGAVQGQSLRRVVINDEWVDLDTANPHADYGLPPMAGSKYAGKLWVKFYDGSQTSVDPMLLEKYGEHADYPWTTAMVGEGIAYAICTFAYNRTLYSGMPKVLFELDGIPLYDPRLDDTAGGTGTQRWGDPTTWVQSDNPVVMIYNLLRGITVAGQYTFGGNVAAADLPYSAWAAEMAKANASVMLSAGGSEAAYRAGIEVRVDDEPAGVIEELLKTCSGDVTNTGGTWSIRIGAPSLSSLSFSDDDILITSPQQLDPFPGSPATHNGITASYPEPVSLYQSREAPPRYNATWEAEDGARRLVADLTLSACPYPNQVQRLMRAYIEDSRRFRTHGMTLPPMAIQVEPLDTISWTSGRNGYLSKLFEVASVEVDPMTLLHRISIRERDATDYNWVSGYELPSNSVVPGLTAPLLMLSGFAAAAVTIKDGSGVDRRAAIKITWDSDQPLATGLEWEVRFAGGTTQTTGTVSDVGRGAHIITRGIVRNTAYEVRARLVAPIPAGWTGWVAIGSADVRIQPDDLADTLTVPGPPSNLQLSSALLSDAKATLAAAWTAGTNAVAYDVGVTRSGGNEVILAAGGTSFEFETVAGAQFAIRVRSVSATGTKSPWTASGNIVAATDTTAPAAPTGLTATTGFETYWLEWDANTESDLSHYRIRQRIGANTSANQKYYTTTGTSFAITGAPAGEVSWFRVYAVDASDNQSAVSAATVPASVTVPSGVTSADVSGIIDATSFATGMTGVEVVASLPATGSFDGRTAVLTTDGKLYRYSAGSWTSAVPSVDISGQLVASQLAGIEAAKVSGQLTNAQIADLAATKVSGQLNDAQIAGIAASKLTGQVVAAQIADGAVGAAKFASGLTPVEIVSTLPSTGNFDGRQAMLTTDGKLYRYTSGAWTASVKSADITGTIAAAQIAALEASKITGQLTDAQIADLGAAKLTGQITQTQITDNSVSTSKIAASAIVADKIASSAITAAKIATNAITAAKIAAGTITANEIAANAITASEIAADAVTASQIAANAITATQIAADAVTTAKIQAGAVTADEVAAGAITASKVAIGDFTNLNPDRDYKDEALWSGASGFYSSTAASWKSNKVMKIIGGATSYAFVYGPRFQVAEGEELLVRVVSKIQSGAGSLSLNLRFSEAEAITSVTDVWPSPTVGHNASAVTELSGAVTVPVGMKWAQIRCYKSNNGATEARIGMIEIRRKATGELIVDGAITAGKIAANTITTDKLATSAITAVKVSAGAITTGKIATDAVTANEIAANTITASEVQAGTITSAEIKTNAISSKNLIIGDFDNLIPDGSFSDGDLTLFPASGGASGSLGFTTDAVSGRNAMTINKTVLTDTVYTNGSPIGYFPVKAGDVYYGETEAKTQSGTATAGFYYRIRWYGPTGAYIGYSNIASNKGLTTAWKVFTAEVTAPAGAALAGTQLYNHSSNTIVNTFIVDRIVLRKKDGATLIVDGSLTATHIAANTITASKIAASAITANEVAANAITAGKIAAGAVSADQIAAKAIVASKLAVTDFTNLNADDNFDDIAYWNVTGSGQSMVFANTSNTTAWGGTRYAKLSGPAGTYCVVYGPTLTVDPLGEELWLRHAAKVQTGGGFTYVNVECAEDAAFTINKSYKNLGSVTATSVTEMKGKIILPAGSRFIRLRMVKGNTTTTESRIGGVQLRRKGRGELIVDGSIVAANLDTVNAVITGTAQIKNSIITNAKITDLSAAKLTAATALAGSITVSGTALSNVESRADDPAARVNAKTTLIDPGKITVSGATTLSDWRMGGDLTKINGGEVSANTIDANKLTIGQRGIQVDGIIFSTSGNVLSWTSGAIRFITDVGAYQYKSISSGSVTYSGSTQHVYWEKGATVLGTTTSPSDAMGHDERISLAVYTGTTKVTSSMGRTIIDGDSIKTGAITAAKMTVTDLSAISANLGTISVTNANIASLTVGTTEITGNAVTKVRKSTSNTPSISWTPTVSGEYTVMFFGEVSTTGVGSATATLQIRVNGVAKGGKIEAARIDASPDTSSAADKGVIVWKGATSANSTITIDTTGNGTNCDLVVIETKK